MFITLPVQKGFQRQPCFSAEPVGSIFGRIADKTGDVIDGDIFSLPREDIFGNPGYEGGFRLGAVTAVRKMVIDEDHQNRVDQMDFLPVRQTPGIQQMQENRPGRFENFIQGETLCPRPALRFYGKLTESHLQRRSG